jgi:hypothetical protein
MGMVTVGADHHFSNLSGEALKTPGDERSTTQHQQSFICATHPPSLPPGKQQSTDFRDGFPGMHYFPAR